MILAGGKTQGKKTINGGRVQKEKKMEKASELELLRKNLKEKAERKKNSIHRHLQT